MERREYVAREDHTHGRNRFGRLFNRRVMFALLLVIVVEIIATQAGAAPGSLPAGQTVTVPTVPTPTITPTQTPTTSPTPAPIAVIEAGSVALGEGKTGTVDVTVSNIVSADGLGSFELNVSFDSGVISVGVPQGGDTPFVTLLDPATPDDAGTVSVIGEQTDVIPGPTGSVVIARLTVTAVGAAGESSSLIVASGGDGLQDTTGVGIPAISVQGTVQIVEGARVVVSSLTNRLAGATGTISVTVADLADEDGLGAYDFAIAYNPSVVRVDEVRGGAGAFSAVPVASINDTTGSVRWNAFQSGIPGPIGEILVAELDISVVGGAGASTALTLTVHSIVDSSGEDLPATVTNGVVSRAAPPNTPVPANTPVPQAPATPTPTPTFTPTPTATPITVVEESDVTTTVTVDPDTSTATDGDGNTVEVGSGEVSVTKEDEGGGGQITIQIPVMLDAGETLDSFEDETSGVVVTKDEETGEVEVRIPLKNAEGDVQASIVAKLEDAPKGQGDSAEAVVKELVLETGPTTADLSAADPDVGEVEVQISALLTDVPVGASIGFNVAKELDPETQQGFELAATNAESQIGEIAYALEVVKESLPDGDVVGASEIVMCVGLAWFEKNGADTGLFSVFRLDDSGNREILPTRRDPARETATQVCFVGDSQNGLSIFALIALEITADAEPTPEVGDSGELTLALSPVIARTLVSSDARVEISVPEGAVLSASTVQYTSLSEADSPNADGLVGWDIRDPRFKLDVLSDGVALSGFTFGAPIMVTIALPDSQVTGNEAAYRVAHFDEGRDAWTIIASTIDSDGDEVRAETTRTGVFGLAILIPVAQPTSTPETPSVGDDPPSSALLFVVMVMGLVLVGAGVRLLSASKASRGSA